MNYILLIFTALCLGLILFSLLSALDVAFGKYDKMDYSDKLSCKVLFYLFVNRVAYILIIVSIMFLIITVIDSVRVSCPDAAVFIKCEPFIWETSLN